MFRSFLFPKKSNLPLHPTAADKMALMESMIFLKGSKNVSDFMGYLMDHRFEIPTGKGNEKVTSRFLVMQLNDLIKKNKITSVTDTDLLILPEHGGFRDKVKDLLILDRQARVV